VYPLTRMPFVVSCAACGKRLNIPDKLYEEKIRGHVVTIACKGCSADIKVDGTRPRAEIDLSAVEAKAGGVGSPGPVAASGTSPTAAAPTAAVAPPADGTPAGPAAAPAAGPGPVAASTTSATRAAGAPGAGPIAGGRAPANTAPAALSGLGGLPRPGAARAPAAAPRPALGSSPQVAPGAKPATAPGPALGSSPQAAPAAAPAAASAGRDFARMTFPGTPAALGRGGAGPAAPGRGFQPMVARPGAPELPGDPDAEAHVPATAVAESSARRRGVPVALRRTAPESPAARLTGPEASTDPTLPPTRQEGAAEGKGNVDPPTAGGVSDWLWAVSFADDDDRELTFAEVKAAILARQVDAETIAWREGLSDWLPLGEIDVFRPVFAELARSPAAPRAGAHPAGKTSGAGAAATTAGAEPQAAPAAGEGAPAAVAPSAESPPRDVAAPVTAPAAPAALAAGEASAASSSPLPDTDDDREVWRRSTADLLAELAGGAQQLRPGLPVGATPVAPEPESLPPLPRPPAAPKFSLSPSLTPPRSASRVIAYVVVALLVVAALAGIVLLITKGLASSDDPTLRPVAAPAVRPSVAAAASGRVPAPGTAEATGSSSTPATYGSSATDLAVVVRENVDRSGGPTGTPFDERTAREVLAEAAGRAALCRKPGDEKGPAKAAVTFDPATGRPSDVRLLGRYAGTGSGACIVATLRAVRTKRFSGEPVTLEQTVMLR